MFNLPYELILEIWGYVSGNSDMVALRLCNKYAKETGDKYGYIKHLELSMDAHYMNLVKIWNGLNLMALQSLSVRGFRSPANWIPFSWPKQVSFVNCPMGANILSPPSYNTTNLSISDSGIGILKVDWNKFPNLRKLSVNYYSMDIESLKVCRKLEHLSLSLRKRGEKLPTWIADLPRLTTLRSNLKPKGKMHFTSNLLKICLVPKRRVCVGNRVLPCSMSCCQRFTAVSRLVPEQHLLCDCTIRHYNYLL